MSYHVPTLFPVIPTSSAEINAVKGQTIVNLCENTVFNDTDTNLLLGRDKGAAGAGVDGATGLQGVDGAQASTVAIPSVCGPVGNGRTTIQSGSTTSTDFILPSNRVYVITYRTVQKAVKSVSNRSRSIY